MQPSVNGVVGVSAGSYIMRACVRVRLCVCVCVLVMYMYVCVCVCVCE